MMKARRARYRLECKQEAVGLVEAGQAIAAASRTLGLVEQTLFNWVKAYREGKLKGADSGSKVTAEQIEIQPVAGGFGARDDGARHCGKSYGVLRQGTEVKYALIGRNRRLWPIHIQCRMLGVSVAGYDEHLLGRLHLARRRHLSAEALIVLIRAVYAANRGAYGWPRIWRELHAQGIRVGKQRVQRLMQQAGIRARGKRRFPVTTTDSGHNLPIVPNLLNRNFTVEAPNQVGTGEITCIPTDEGWLFLAVVIDLFSRRIVGWSMQSEMRSSLVMDALRMAWLRRSPDKGTRHIFHSDRASQYASHEPQPRSPRVRHHGLDKPQRKLLGHSVYYLLERRLDLTRAGIGQVAFALTCRSVPALVQHCRVQP